MAVSAYATLGLVRTATTAEIRLAYRTLAKQYHPDVAGPAGEAKFIAIRAAYELLADPDRRRSYDESPEDDGRAEAELIAILRRRRNERRRQRLMRLY